MWVMVRALLFQILLTLKFIHRNAHLLYPIFYMFLTLKNLCYLFKSFVLRIMSSSNFIPFYFMLRTTWQRKCFFPVGVEMIYMFCSSRLQRHCLRFSHLHVSLLPLMSGIVDVGIPVHVFCNFYARMMILPASTCKSQRPCLINLLRLADRSLWQNSNYVKPLGKKS